MSLAAFTHHNIAFSSDKLDALCRENRIKKLLLFGSILRDDFGPESDIDMLVEFMPGEIVGFFRLSRIERALSDFFGGRKVDLRTYDDLSDYFRDRVEAGAEEVYVH